ncbi:MAG: prolipoprotein diacylglyceryl transferase [Granulosicoccaceae bacterium]
MQFPNIDPVAIALGPVQIHWYGLMYMVGFLSAWWLIRRWVQRPNSGWTLQQVDDLIFYCALGVVLGGRVGYTLFYNLPAFFQDPLMIVRLWEGGMSFHGGILGVTVAMYLFARKTGHGFMTVADRVALVTPIGLGAGRIGNFINSELWGRTTEVPWGVVFPNGGPLPRHPSQLYEFALEGVVLFLVLALFTRRSPPAGAIAALMVLLYGIFRFLVEFVRMPDEHLGFVAFGWMTRGQVLCLPMIAIGIVVLIWAYRRARAATELG